MADPVFTVGDTAPSLTGTVNASLVGATVELHLQKPSGAVLTGAASVADAATGAWSYPWAAPIDEEGTWVVEAQVTFSNGTIQTFGRSQFRVQAQIA